MLHADTIAKLRTLPTAAGIRVFHENVPQDTPLPFIATTVIFDEQPTTLDGKKLLSSAQLRSALFGSGEQIEAMKAVIRRNLNGFRGVIAGPPAANGVVTGTRVATIRVQSSSDEVAFADGDKVIKGAALDLFFKYYEE